jgi:8-oxo-dGTP pyrophosphatase MutT (NUDIX family)
VRYSDVVARLATLPDPLPAAPSALMPVVADERPRPSTPVAGGSSRRAAVLVLIIPAPDGEARVVVTERVVGGRYHSGEVSFPGGAAEPQDGDAAATALREAAEEIALDPETAGVRVVGNLDLVWIPVSGFTITPVLAIADRRPVLFPAEAEVARIVEAPVSAFLPDAPIEIVEATIRDWPLRYGAYPVEGLLIWGATARILGQLGAVIASSSNPAQTSRSPAR